MAIGLRTEDLRKIYNSAPPFAAGGVGVPRASASGDKPGKQPKPQIVALDGISLQVEGGEIFGLLGPNGAGKSTTVGVLTTRVRPTSGQAWIGDHDVWKDQAVVKRLIGVVPQRPNLDFSLTAGEILTFHGAYFGLSSKDRNQRAGELLEKFKLTDRANQMVRGFSGGMMQRLSIARAMMHDPQVLFLDEPSAGLDPQTRILLWEIIREYNQAGKTILLTTHNMEEADALCQRLAIIDHGKVIAVDTPAGLKGSIPGGFRVTATFREAHARPAAGSAIAFRRPRSAIARYHRRRRVRRSRRLADSRDCQPGADHRRGTDGRSHLRAQPGKFISAPHRKEPARLNWKTFGALLARDAHVAKRNAIQLFLQTFLQPLMFVFIFGRVMVRSGYMPASYKALLLPGIMAISMVFTGIWAVAMPLIAEFQWTREIEDRLLAPIETIWLAIEKSSVRNDSGHSRGLDRASLGLAFAAPHRYQHSRAAYVRRDHHPGRRIFRLRRPCAWAAP